MFSRPKHPLSKYGSIMILCVNKRERLVCTSALFELQSCRKSAMTISQLVHSSLKKRPKTEYWQYRFIQQFVRKTINSIPEISSFSEVVKE